MEREGYINTVASKGCYVAPRNIEQIKEEYLKQIEEHMRSIILLSNFCGLSEEELALMFHLMKKGEM